MLSTIRGSFRSKFFIFVGGTIFIFLTLLTLISYLYLKKQSFQTSSQQAQYSVQQLNNHLKTFFYESKLFLNTLSQNIHIHNRKSLKNSFKSAFLSKKSEYSSLLIATENNQFLKIKEDEITKNIILISKNRMDIKKEIWYLKTKRNKSFSVTTIKEGLSNSVILSFPVLKKGIFIGVIASKVDSEKFSHFLNKNPLAYRGKIIIFDNNNQLLLKQISKNDFLSKNKKQWEAFLFHPKIFNNVRLNQQDFMLIASHINFINWNLISLFSHSNLMQNSYSFLKNILSIYLVLIFLLSVIITLLVSKLLKPVHSLKQTIRNITNGNIQHRATVHSKDEFGELAFRFNKMADSIQEKNEEIGKHNFILEKTVKEKTHKLQKSYKILKVKNLEITQQMLMAQRVQQNILPQKEKLPKRKELDFGAQYLSVENVGGDLFDVIRIGKNSYGFLMADVSGHGLPAALITSMAKVSFHSHSRWGHKPCEVCQNVNKDIFNFIGDLEHYFTASYCILDLETGVLQYSNAGHLPIFIYRSHINQIETLFIKGSLIGIFEKGFYQSKAIKLEKGDKVLLFTDGLPEARNKKQEFYQLNRLKRLFKKLAYLSPQIITDLLIADLQSFREGLPLEDDQAILCIEFKGCCSKIDSKNPVDFQKPMSSRNFTQ